MHSDFGAGQRHLQRWLQSEKQLPWMIGEISYSAADLVRSSFL